MHQPSHLPELLANCDFIVNTLPSTEETQGLLGGGALLQCRQGAVLINIGRGDICTEQEIVTGIEEGPLAGAVLDVFTQEPLPASSALWGLAAQRKVVITPHVSAMSLPDQVAHNFVTNMELFLDQKPLQYEFDWE